jgi:hypothetical protein
MLAVLLLSVDNTEGDAENPACRLSGALKRE